MVRVIAGRFGGRRLVAPRGEATRPTADRVKEALFSALGDRSGATVLDLYAGTGALGLEALSRGATRVVFVESSSTAQEALRKNIATLGVASETQVLGVAVERAAGKLSALGPFDLVFADPPYADLAHAIRAIEALARAGAIAPEATLTLEHAAVDRPALTGFQAADVRRYGTTAITVFVRSAQALGAAEPD